MTTSTFVFHFETDLNSTAKKNRPKNQPWTMDSDSEDVDAYLDSCMAKNDVLLAGSVFFWCSFHGFRSGLVLES